MEISIKCILISVLIVESLNMEHELSCEYEDTSDFGDESRRTFSCRLHIYNSNGFDDFERIPGNHDLEVNAIEKSVGHTTNIPSILCRQFANLEILSLAERGIETISREAMENCGNLGALYLSKNNIRDVQTNALDNLISLRFLDLEQNKIEKFPDNVFLTLVNLEWLSLSHNPLGQFSTDLLKSLKSLKYLFLSNCDINSIESDMLSANEKLSYIDMSKNKIASLPTSLFSPLPELRYLDMSNNAIKILSSSAFNIVTLDKLITLNFNYNSLQSIDPKLFKNAKNLKNLRFLENECVDIKLEANLVIEGTSIPNNLEFSAFEQCYFNFHDGNNEIKIEL